MKYLATTYLLILLLLTVIPLNGEDSALNDNYLFSIRWDYIGHALVYLPLPVLISLVWRNALSLWIVLVVSLVIAAGFELLQGLVPYRAFNVNDMAGNGVGVVVGWLAVCLNGLKGK